MFQPAGITALRPGIDAPLAWMGRVFLLLVWSSTAASQQTYAPPVTVHPGSIFVPEDFVPLSQFVKKDSLTATMHVHPDILEWIDDQPGGQVKVAVRQNGQISIVNPTTVGTSKVKLSGPLMGDCVVVSTALKHILQSDTSRSIQTHWNDEGHGHQEFGAKDGLDLINFDPINGVFVLCEEPPCDDDPLLNMGSGDYFYSVDLHDLFSDGSGAACVQNAKTPGFERYIGETYSINAVTDLAAVAHSDLVRKTAGGWPVAHWNAGEGANFMVDAKNEWPVFQVVHCHVVAIPDDCCLDDPCEPGAEPCPGSPPCIPGSENSLASLVLPPEWDSTDPIGTYKLLFNGFYDINGSVFSLVSPGMEFFVALGNAHQNSNRAVAVFWNGGGAIPTQTQHPSAYENAAQLFQDAKTMLRADIENIVMIGGSRGGTTALGIACNPLNKDYGVAYVHATTPNVRWGDLLHRYVQPGHDALQLGMERLTGYKESWSEDWVVPVGEPDAGMSRESLVRRVMFGPADGPPLGYLAIENDWSIDSELFRGRLEEENPVVILSITTNDNTRPLVHLAEYVNHLEATDLSVLCNVLYTFGHGLPENEVRPTPSFILQHLFDETLPPFVETPGEVVVQNFGADRCNPGLAVPFTAPHVPAALEMPIVTGFAQDFTIGLFGEPNAVVEVETALLPLTFVPGNGLPNGTDFEQVLRPATVLSLGPVFGTFVHEVHASPELPLDPGYHWYRFSHDPSGPAAEMFGEGDLPLLLPRPGCLPPGSTQLGGTYDCPDLPITEYCYDEPLLLVLDCEEQVIGKSENTRIGGLSGDGLHLYPNGVPCECLPDCDSDGTPDLCEEDSNGNGIPDDCE